MRQPKYPLELAAQLRAKRVNEAARTLAGASGERERTERHRVQAERRRDAHDTAAQRTRSSERDALSRGELRAADLSRTAAWEVGVAGEREARAGEVSQASAGAAKARAAELQAQEQLLARRAENQLVINHQARWHDEQRKRKEAQQEEDSEEVWRCRANKPKP